MMIIIIHNITYIIIAMLYFIQHLYMKRAIYIYDLYKYVTIFRFYFTLLNYYYYLRIICIQFFMVHRQHTEEEYILLDVVLKKKNKKKKCIFVYTIYSEMHHL